MPSSIKNGDDLKGVKMNWEKGIEILILVILLTISIKVDSTIGCILCVSMYVYLSYTKTEEIEDWVDKREEEKKDITEIINNGDSNGVNGNRQT